MRFSTALIYMKRGHKVRCPEWGGYWYWLKEEETIIIRTREGEELDIRDTEDMEYTLSFINRDDWVFVE